MKIAAPLAMAAVAIAVAGCGDDSEGSREPGATATATPGRLALRCPKTASEGVFADISGVVDPPRVVGVVVTTTYEDETRERYAGETGADGSFRMNVVLPEKGTWKLAATVDEPGGAKARPCRITSDGEAGP